MQEKGGKKKAITFNQGGTVFFFGGKWGRTTRKRSN